MYKCEYCGREFETFAALAGHVSHCKENPNSKRHTIDKHDIALRARETYIKNNPYKYEVKEFELTCKKCGKKYTLNMTQSDYDKGKYCHYCSIGCRNSRQISDEVRRKISETLRNGKNGKPSKLYHTPLKIHHCKVCGKPFTIKDIRDVGGTQYCSKECKHKFLSEHTGGYRKGSGRGKSGWYKGVYCDSSWELAYVVYNMDNNIPIQRCKEQRTYMFEGKENIYLPDFIVNGEIVEIKGYSTNQWKAKIEANPDIKVLYKTDMKPYLDYVSTKYGSDFIKLYDGSNPKFNFKERKYVWVHKDNKNALIHGNEYDEYISNGWVYGRLNIPKIKKS